MPPDPRFDRHPPRRDGRSTEPLVYESAGVSFPMGTVVGDPATYTYRILWCQGIPYTKKFGLFESLPFVTTDRSIVLRYGTGDPTVWGVPCILCTLALRTPTLCCVHLHVECYGGSGWVTLTRWWYCRITDADLHTIKNGDLSRKEWNLLTAATRKEPLRSSVGGKDTAYSRAPVIYRYPAKKEKEKEPPS